MDRPPGDTGLRGRLVAASLLLAGLIAGAFGLVTTDVDADEVLQNAGFESWSGDSPVAWIVTSGDPSREDSRSVTGSSLHIGGAHAEAVIEQTVPMSAGGAMSVSIAVSSDTNADASLAVYPLDGDFIAQGAPLTATLQPIGAGTGFTTVSENFPHFPPWTEYARISIRVDPLSGSGTLSVYFDTASASVIVAPPTATPTSTPTPGTVDGTPTDTGTETGDATSTPTSSGGGKSTATPTQVKATKTPTRKPTPKPPKLVKTPTPTPQPKQTPTPTNPDAVMTGLLLNGDFEALDNGKPAYWSKYGGDMGATGDAYAGSWSATLSSTTSSTKWLSQVVPVTGSAWYRLSAAARAENATAFLRVSWYASTDGSGSQIDAADGSETSSTDWTSLGTDTIQAPADANSARIKLMLRPIGGAGRVIFDDAWFVAADAPAATSTPSPGAKTTPSRTSAPRKTATPRKSTGTGRSATATKTPKKGSATSKPPGGHQPAALSGAVRVSGAGPLWLSEFMSDPPRPGSDGSDEWVEVVNIGSETVSTAGWHISDAKASDEIPAIDVPAGGYLVIAGKAAELPAGIAIVRIGDGAIGNGLNNDGDAIALVAPSGETVDAISYGDNIDIFEPPPPAPEAGKTLGNRAPGADEAAENWDLTLAPSPGEANSFEPDEAEDTAGGADDVPADEAPHDADAGRTLTIGGERDTGGLGTLDWILLGIIVAAAGVFAVQAGRRYGQPLWKRLRRDR